MAKRLTEPQREQIRNMKADGKKAGEIQDFMKQTYKIKISPAGIAYVCKGISRKARKYHRTERPVAKIEPIQGTPKELSKSVSKLLADFQAQTEEVTDIWKNVLLGISGLITLGQDQIRSALACQEKK